VLAPVRVLRCFVQGLLTFVKCVFTPKCLLTSLGSVYLLRGPLLTGSALLVICVLAFTLAGSYMGGAFDINSKMGIFWVSLVAFMFASAVEVTWRLVRSYGPMRFSSAVEPRPADGLCHSVGYALLVAVVALPPIGGAIYKSTTLSLPNGCKDILDYPYECIVLPPLGAILYACLGLIAFLIITVAGASIQLLFSKPVVARESTDLFLLTAVRPMRALFRRLGRRDPIGWVVDFMTTRGSLEATARQRQRVALDPEHTERVSIDQSEEFGRGYRFRYRDADGRLRYAILPGHIVAVALLVLTLLVYICIGVVDVANIESGDPTTIPTLCYVLLLLTILCWGFSGLAFFLDRYRVPVFTPILAILLFTSFFPYLKSDYYYRTMAPEPEVGEEPSSEDSMIVVAASGGGIQSAAWTARVLTGLEQKCREVDCEREFDESVRLISAASGGSVGTMYFVNEYEDGHLPDEGVDPLALEKIVARAENSSLDYVLWGLLYPDLMRLFIPALNRPEWDRGRALQEAWLLKGDEDWDTRVRLEEGLSQWRNDARNDDTDDDRPAVIFNTTVTEEGWRLPLTTTEPLEGRIKHKRVLPRKAVRTDVSVVTATRLSAAFPYISPAARADVSGTAGHLVDGGYYDNYGVFSLVEWLDSELENNGDDIQEVLIIEIQGWGAPCDTESQASAETTSAVEQTAASIEGTASKDTPARAAGARDAEEDRVSRKRGWFFQAFAPLWTVLNVRGPAQSGNNDVALDLLQERWEGDVEITTAQFSFDGTDPPTSWHLTEAQKRDIQASWEAELNKGCNRKEGWDRVTEFLGAPPAGSEEAAEYKQ